MAQFLKSLLSLFIDVILMWPPSYERFIRVTMLKAVDSSFYTESTDNIVLEIEVEHPTSQARYESYDVCRFKKRPNPTGQAILMNLCNSVSDMRKSVFQVLNQPEGRVPVVLVVMKASSGQLVHPVLVRLLKRKDTAKCKANPPSAANQKGITS